tara:strand:- start:1302 stop:1421 length:120 start_codon:yes stop_codon:yes gene_type:complete
MKYTGSCHCSAVNIDRIDKIDTFSFETMIADKINKLKCP